MSKIVPYSEGTWFAVPLRTGGFGAGRVVRANAKSGILVGYFFGPKLDQVPSLHSVEHTQPGTAILIAQFGHLGLAKGSWTVIGSAPLDRDLWPVPQFVRRDLLNGKVSKVTYSPDDPAQEIANQPASDSEAEHLPKDGILGHGAVEIKLAKLLEERAPVGQLQ
jgi:hypothetical protein